MRESHVITIWQGGVVPPYDPDPAEERMERRMALRARTDFGVIAHEGCMASSCRGIELSASGIILDRGRGVVSRDHRLVLRLELKLPERLRAIFALARPIWALGSQQACRFVQIADADRLNLAEHLDVLRLRGVVFA